jgi:hypothetical protein
VGNFSGPEEKNSTCGKTSMGIIHTGFNVQRFIWGGGDFTNFLAEPYYLPLSRKPCK